MCEDCKKKDALLRDAVEVLNAYAYEEGYTPHAVAETYQRLVSALGTDENGLIPPKK